MEHQIDVKGNNEKCRFQVNHIDIDEGQEEYKAYLQLMECCLTRFELKMQRLKRPRAGESLSPCIFKFIGDLGRVFGGDYKRPHVVSIGPYHRGNGHLVDFEDNKWYFLRKLLSRMTAKSSRDLGFFLKEMRELEAHTRYCYVVCGDIGCLPSYDFVEMMLLDGCFVIELLRYLRKSEDETNKDDDDPISITPSIIPLLIADLLKLENQLPFFVLESLFACSRTSKHEMVLLPLIMEAIELAFPLPTKVSFAACPPKHLLDLVYKSLMPMTYTSHEKHNQHMANTSIQCVIQLRLSGIKLKPRKSVGFLDIKFKNGVLEIPTINISNFTMNLITNCLAWEQYSKDAPTYFTDYIYFMNCLINGPKDVALLCADGINTRHSRDDASVVSYFNSLGKNIAVFNPGTSYLSQEMREIEAYYCSNWATIMRTLSDHNSPSSHSSSMPSLFS